ncbi:MAG: endolytic transglycosylase MltG [bacterium]|nr:endolytic transglycosylase MltG [bacterium]
MSGKKHSINNPVKKIEARKNLKHKKKPYREWISLRNKIYLKKMLINILSFIKNRVGISFFDRKNRNLLTVIFLLIFFTLSFLFYEIKVPGSFDSDLKMIYIPKGAGTKRIAQLLYDKQIIKNKSFFRIYARVTGYENDLRAGSFRLSPSYSLSRVADILINASGAADLVKVTVPEGYQIVEIADLLERANLVIKDDFIRFLKYEAQDMFVSRYPFIKFAKDNNIEGYLFPETYFFARDVSYADIVEAFLKQFKEKIVPVWRADEAVKGSPKQRFHFYNIITIASIIQKEAAVKSEMPYISSVFYNRLKKRMPLAADPTIVYALGKSWKNRVTYKDLKINSPYNTYRRSGFPPTPIASFGVEAFKAALNPLKTSYLFFVSNRDRTHSFTETYEEHLKIQHKIKKMAREKTNR